MEEVQRIAKAYNTQAIIIVNPGKVRVEINGCQYCAETLEGCVKMIKDSFFDMWLRNVEPNPELEQKIEIEKL